MSTLRENILDHLKAKGSYDEIDDEQVDMLIENIELYKLAMKEVRKSGTVIQQKNGVYKLNPSLLGAQMFFRNINLMSQKLGISRIDRIKLKLIAEKTASEFEELLKT